MILHYKVKFIANMPQFEPFHSAQICTIIKIISQEWRCLASLHKKITSLQESPRKVRTKNSLNICQYNHAMNMQLSRAALDIARFYIDKAWHDGTKLAHYHDHTGPTTSAFNHIAFVQNSGYNSETSSPSCQGSLLGLPAC